MMFDQIMDPINHFGCILQLLLCFTIVIVKLVLGKTFEKQFILLHDNIFYDIYT